MSGASQVLIDLIKEYSFTRYQKVLTVAPDVEKMLKDRAVRPTVTNGMQLGDEAVLVALMGIDVHVAEDAPPGSWRLVRHDACEVHYPRGYEHPEESFVSHEECTILAESSR